MKPRLLDLFCKAGGAGMGYARAGFEVVGVDIEPQPRYPFRFLRGSVFDLSPSFIESFDAIHASPPCQFATPLRHAPNGKEHQNLIPQTRELLKAYGVPYVIENVALAAPHLIDPIRLCGTSFGLGAQGCDLHRHRLFECSFPVQAPACDHDPAKPVIGCYGGHARKRSAKHGGRGTRDVWEGGHIAAMSQALGIDWMTTLELSEAIPPAFTEYLGSQLMAHQKREAAA